VTDVRVLKKRKNSEGVDKSLLGVAADPLLHLAWIPEKQ
jgi:hypothetical protein